MDATIPLPLTIIATLLALGLGYIIALFTAEGRVRRLAAEREEQTRAKYERFQHDVNTHFEESSRLFAQVATQYRELYRHVTAGRRQFANGSEKRKTPPSKKPQRQPSVLQPVTQANNLDVALTELRDDLAYVNQLLAKKRPRRKTPEAVTPAAGTTPKAGNARNQAGKTAPKETASIETKTDGPPVLTAVAASNDVQWKRLAKNNQPKKTGTG